MLLLLSLKNLAKQRLLDATLDKFSRVQRIWRLKHSFNDRRADRS